MVFPAWWLYFPRSSSVQKQTYHWSIHFYDVIKMAAGSSDGSVPVDRIAEARETMKSK